MVNSLDIEIEKKLFDLSSGENFFGGELKVTYTFAENSARPGWVDKPGEFWEDCL